jgi:hypothetical protein
MSSSGGITDEDDMPISSFHETANRLRQIGDSLTDSADQEVVKRYAAELETLARCEVRAPKPIPLKGVEDELGLAVFAGILKSAFPLDASPVFDDLLIALVESD